MSYLEMALKALAGVAQPVTIASAPPVKAESSTATTALCNSPDCAGCYDVGDGRKIHPPKCGEDYRKWLERWKPTGKAQ